MYVWKHEEGAKYASVVVMIESHGDVLCYDQVASRETH